MKKNKNLNPENDPMYLLVIDYNTEIEEMVIFEGPAEDMFELAKHVDLSKADILLVRKKEINSYERFWARIE